MSQMIDFTCRPASRGGRSTRSAVCRRERCGRCCSSPTGWWSSSTAISRWPRTWPPGASLSPATTTWATAVHPHQRGLWLLRRTRWQPRPAGGSARCDDPDKAAVSRRALFPAGPQHGSFYARQYLCEWGDELDGAIIMGTGYQPKALVQLARTICRVLAVFHGWHYRSNWWPDFRFWGTTRGWRAARPTTGSTVTRWRWTATAPTSAVPLSLP